MLSGRIDWGQKAKHRQNCLYSHAIEPLKVSNDDRLEENCASAMGFGAERIDLIDGPFRDWLPSAGNRDDILPSLPSAYRKSHK